MVSLSVLKVRPLVLIILDGFGVAPSGEGNAITQAKMPIYQKLLTTYLAMSLRSSGDEVGLSWGEMGNSEVGHLTIGAGRVFYQTLPRINKAIESQAFFKNEALLKALAQAKKNNATLHLVGLVSPGGVHSHQEHLYRLLELAKQEKVKRVAVHAILDGRDTGYNTGKDFLVALLAKLKVLKIGVIASVAGRYFAMDRDNRWERTEKAYRAICGTMNQGSEIQSADDPLQAVQTAYEQKVYDEEFIPTVILEKGKPVAPFTEKDAVIFFNFREDRMRQLTKSFVLPAFDKFNRGPFFKEACFVTMTEYEKDLPVAVAFPPEIIATCLAKVVSEAGLRQFHIAETEKYAHITYFLNGLREEAFTKEDREIIPSPKVSVYDKKPEMSAKAIYQRVVKEILAEKYDFIAINLANPDMVGHTGNIEATISGLAAVDRALGEIAEATLLKGGVVLITADHGNAEEMLNLQTGILDKEHSTNPVPFIVVGQAYAGKVSPELASVGGDLALLTPTGTLSDVAPTVLKLLGLPQPQEMTGVALI